MTPYAQSEKRLAMDLRCARVQNADGRLIGLSNTVSDYQRRVRARLRRTERRLTRTARCFRARDAHGATPARPRHARTATSPLGARRTPVAPALARGRRGPRSPQPATLATASCSSLSQRTLRGLTLLQHEDEERRHLRAEVHRLESLAGDLEHQVRLRSLQVLDCASVSTHTNRCSFEELRHS